MSLETDIKSFIGVRPVSYFEVSDAGAYDDRDPLFDASKGSRQQFFADAYSMAMVDYYHKGKAEPFALEVEVAVLVRLTDKAGKTKLVHSRILSDAYFSISELQHFAEAVVIPNTKILTNECRRLIPAANLDKCEVAVFETKQDEFSKIVRSLGNTSTIKPVEIRESYDGHIELNRRFDGFNDFDNALVKFVFEWNMKVDGLKDEEIAEKWKQSPWYREG